MISVILSMIKDEYDRDLVSTMFEKYEKKLFLKAMSITNSREDSEDCVIDVIIAVIDRLEKFKTFSENGQLLYMMRCCENIAIDKYRKNKQKVKYEYSDDEAFDYCADDEANQLDIIISDENCKSILDIIEKMNPRLRDVLYFKCIANMEYEEIAKMLSIPIQQVYVRVYRARQTLIKTQGDKINEILRK